MLRQYAGHRCSHCSQLAAAVLMSHDLAMHVEVLGAQKLLPRTWPQGILEQSMAWWLPQVLCRTGCDWKPCATNAEPR